MGSESNKTASRCTTEAARGTHTYEIVGYSLQKGIGIGKYVQSATFAVGGYDWAILFYPDGIKETSKSCMAFMLEFKSRNATVRASYEVRLLKQNSRLPGLQHRRTIAKDTRMFDATNYRSRGMYLMNDDMDLAKFGYMKDNCFTVECVVTVIKESQVNETKGNSEIEVPPSDITEHLGKLLETKQGADVDFIVGGENFAAHRIVLAMRSPVFRALLCGPMMEASMPCITIKDVLPDVFRALLHFIYTDSLPDMGDLRGDDNSEMIRHLLVAADKYAMDRLKLLCQNILGKRLDVKTVAITLDLAVKFSCSKLKQVCIEFIASSNAMDAVMGTRGYAGLKRDCPDVVIDVLERTIKARKT